MKKEYPNVFQIKDKNEICIFEAENIAEWLKLINGAIEDLQKRLNRLGGARKISDQKVGDVCQSTDAMSSKFYDWCVVHRIQQQILKFEFLLINQTIISVLK